MTPEHVFLILFWIFDAGIGYLIGNRKGRPVLGVTLGFVLGLIGWIILALVKPTHDELVRREREQQRIKSEANAGWMP